MIFEGTAQRGVSEPAEKEAQNGQVQQGCGGKEVPFGAGGAEFAKEREEAESEGVGTFRVDEEQRGGEAVPGAEECHHGR